MKELIGLLGLALFGLAVFAMVLALLYIVLRSFHEGREVSFWPPRIGPKISTEEGDPAAPVASAVIPETVSVGIRRRDNTDSTELPSFPAEDLDASATSLPTGIIGMLRVLNGESKGLGLLMTSFMTSILVGRDPQNDLAVRDDRGLSLNHFKVRISKGGDGYDLYVADLGSTNGTDLNGGAVSSLSRLKNGDIIRAGATNFQVLVFSLFSR